MLHPRQLEFESSREFSFEGIFDEFSEIAKGCDFVIGNFETTFSGFTKVPEQMTPYFCAPDNFAKILKKVGFSHLVLCNNHMVDFGIEGYHRTKKIITNAGMFPIDSKEIFFHKDTNIEIINFTTHFNDESLLSKSSADRYKFKAYAPNVASNIKIAFAHWGGQYNPEPNSEQVKLSKELIKNGYNIIIGSGPHTPHDVVKLDSEKMIAFSLGDFLSAHDKPGSTDIGKIVKIEFLGSYISDIKIYDTNTETKNGKSIIRITDAKF